MFHQAGKRLDGEARSRCSEVRGESTLQINLLGVPEVCRDGVHRNVPKGNVLALLAYLAVEGGLRPREEVAALLWPQAGEQEGRGNLRTTLTMLRKALGEQPGSPAVLRTVANAIGLEPSAVLVDVHALETAAALVRQGKAVPDLRSQLEHAVAAWHGPLLNGISLRDAPDFETWLLGRREDADRWMSEILARLASIYEDAGDPAAAVAALERWVRHDALNEEAHRRLLAAHLAAGNITAGLRAYDACRAALTMELGSEPNLEIQVLAEQLEAAAHRPAAAPTPRTSDSGGVPEPPLVGRARELVALGGCFAQAQQGQAQVVVLSGEFGIGKTRLAREFLATIRAQGGDVLQGQAFEQSHSVPYAAVVEALRPRLERENAPEDLLDDLWLAALTRVLPELCARYPDLAAAAAGCTEAHLFEAIVRLIHALAEQQPVVLFLDDAQWIDGATRELVRYALRRWAQCGTRVLLLLAVRVEDLATTAALATWLEQLDRSAPTTRLALGPLTPTATIRLLGAVAGAEPDAQQSAGGSAEAHFGAWLAAETGGQPFFIMETLKALLQDGAMAWRPDAARGWTLDMRGALRDPDGLRRTVPARVQEAIMTHLGRRSQAAITLLAAGAVLGTHFTFEQVCQVAELSEREALEGLDEAVRAQLLREDALGGYGFCYDMLRTVVSAQAGAARRQLFWRRARALVSDRVTTAPLSDQGAAADVALIPTGTDAGGPIVRGGQGARAGSCDDQTAAALGLARSPFPQAFDEGRLERAMPAQVAQGGAERAAAAAAPAIAERRHGGAHLQPFGHGVEGLAASGEGRRKLMERGVPAGGRLAVAGLPPAGLDPFTATVVAVRNEGEGVRDAVVRAAPLPASRALRAEAQRRPAMAPARAPGAHDGRCHCCGPPGSDPQWRRRTLPQPGSRCRQRRAPRAPRAERPRRGGTDPAV